jgi:hypothetical protein
LSSLEILISILGLSKGKAMKKTISLALLIVLLEVMNPGLTSSLRSAEPVVTVKSNLVLAIIVDQFRYDYLLRFKSDYKAGIQQLLTRGAVFTNARYEHFPTYTSVGHSTFLSGAYPSVSGIIGNQWYDRDLGRLVRSTSDDSVQIVGGASGPGTSPRSLLVSTIGDEMKIAAQSQCKVLGISLKDYSIILATGHMADGVYWFDERTGSFVTSTYYIRDLPQWTKAFNAKHAAERYKSTEWLGTKLPAEAGPKLYGMIENTPFGNELVEEMAEEAIKGEKLGRSPRTELLVLGFSSNDFVGHQFGPDSPNVRDMSIATDRILGKLFNFVDSQVGMNNVTVIFASDHGVAPLPEINAEHKMPGGRVSFSEVRDAIQKALTQKFGEGKWIASTPEESVYLNWDLIAEKNLTRQEVSRTAAQAASAVPHVFRVYNREQILNGYATEDPVSRRIARSYSARRGADLYVLLDPYYIFGKLSTTHGTPFGYDTHVPVIFMGPGIKAGNFNGSIAVNDIAPTLATILGIEIPSGSEGRILAEIFQDPSRGF